MKSIIFTLAITSIVSVSAMADESLISQCRNVLTARQDLTRACYSTEDNNRIWFEVTTPQTMTGPGKWELLEVEYSKKTRSCVVLGKYIEVISDEDKYVPLPNTYASTVKGHSTRLTILEKRNIVLNLVDQSSEAVKCLNNDE